MRLYHTTSVPSAQTICATGFVDMMDPITKKVGVWLSDRPVDYCQQHGAVVTVEIPDTLLIPRYANWCEVEIHVNGDWKTDDEIEAGFYAFCVPASLANAYPRTWEPW